MRIVSAIVFALIIALTQRLDRSNATLKHQELLTTDVENPGLYYLPNTTEPLHYHINLTTNVSTPIPEKAFTGTINIELKVNEDTSEIVLHARQLKVISANCRPTNGRSTEENVELEVTHETLSEFLRLKPKRRALRFQKNTLWTVTIHYQGELRKVNGFYLSYGKDWVDGKKHYVATTKFEVTDARHAFPCYDEPAKLANFTITLNHNANWQALSNMPVDEIKSKPGTTVFLTSFKMSTYMVAFLVTNFGYTESIHDSVRHRIYSDRGTVWAQQWALETSGLVLKHLSRYCDLAYPLPKIDLVTLDAMIPFVTESWGLVTSVKTLTLTPNNTVPTVRIISEAYSHQWFGNLVTFNSWTYIWLAKGFATLFHYYIPGAEFPESNALEKLQIVILDTLEDDLHRHAITYYPKNQTELEKFDYVVAYHKAGSVLHMLRHALGEKVFRQGLHYYLTENQHKAVEEQQLFDAMQKAINLANYALPTTIAEVMLSWTRQSSHPVLMVTRDYNNGSFTLAQRAYLESERSNRLWYVPFNYVSGSQPDFSDTRPTHYLLKVPQMLIDDAQLANSEWLILSKQHTGLYRINYDAHNWELIKQALTENAESIHKFNRMHLLEDAAYFCRTGELSCHTFFDLLTYLRDEQAYGPWSVASNIIVKLNRQLNADGKNPNFKHFVKTLVGKLYGKLGTLADETQSQMSTRKIAIQLACLSGMESCLKATRKELRTFMEQGRHIETKLQSVMLCNGLKQSTADNDFDYLYKQMFDPKLQHLRHMYISTLICSDKQHQLKQLLDSTIDESNNLASEERASILSGLYKSSDLGLTMVVEFLKNYPDKYANLFADLKRQNTLDNILRGMAKAVTKDEQGLELLELVPKVERNLERQVNLRKALARNMQLNMQWLKLRQDDLMHWFKAFYTKSVLLRY